MDMTVLELVEHPAQILIVQRELLADAGGHTRIIQQIAQALPRQLKMCVAGLGVRLSRGWPGLSLREPASPSGLSAPEDLHQGSPGIFLPQPPAAVRRSPREPA